MIKYYKILDTLRGALERSLLCARAQKEYAHKSKENYVSLVPHSEQNLVFAEFTLLQFGQDTSVGVLVCPDSNVSA
jgi:hypothetical protein